MNTDISETTILPQATILPVEERSFEERKSEINRLRKTYPNKIPVLVFIQDEKLPKLTNVKFLLSDDFTMNEITYILRKRLDRIEDDHLYLYINNNICLLENILGQLPLYQIYKDEKSDDGFLRIIVRTTIHG